MFLSLCVSGIGGRYEPEGKSAIRGGGWKFLALGRLRWANAGVHRRRDKFDRDRRPLAARATKLPVLKSAPTGTWGANEQASRRGVDRMRRFYWVKPLMCMMARRNWTVMLTYFCTLVGGASKAVTRTADLARLMLVGRTPKISTPAFFLVSVIEFR